jgi:hypothetical protein
MSTDTLPGRPKTSATIFASIWESWGEMSPSVARHVLKLHFSEDDTRRMHELAGKNQQGVLSLPEMEELDNYVKVGDLIAILQSKARKLLKKKPASTVRHGR